MQWYHISYIYISLTLTFLPIMVDTQFIDPLGSFGEVSPTVNPWQSLHACLCLFLLDAKSWGFKHVQDLSSHWMVNMQVQYIYIYMYIALSLHWAHVVLHLPDVLKSHSPDSSLSCKFPVNEPPIRTCPGDKGKAFQMLNQDHHVSSCKTLTSK